MNSKQTISLYQLVIIIGLIACGVVFAGDTNPNQLFKASGIEIQRFEGNHIATWMDNQGHLTRQNPDGTAGGEWPAGSGKTAVFTTGLWAIGQVDGELRSAVAEYQSEWSPGTIPYDTETMLPTSDVPLNTPLHEIYHIQQGNSSDPASANYAREYATWPASDGAPAHDGEFFDDLNGNDVWDNNENYEDFDRDGVYDPPDGQFVTGEDPPLLSGDEMAWYVMNDWDTTAHNNLWDTAPMGLEAQVLIYTLPDEPIYDNVQFHTITLVNKSGGPIDSLYYAYWSDIDLGDGSDDAVGCDPEYSLGYAYNHSRSDLVYGLRPPAVGYDMLPSDYVYIGDPLSIPDEPQGMTAFVFYLSGDSRYRDPETAEEAYNSMRGLRATDGIPYIEPWGSTSTFLQPGDPVNHTGWTDIDFRDAGDRRFLMSSGPYYMETWDDLDGNGRADFGEPGVQIINTALIIVDGADHLDAINNLKYISQYAERGFDYGFDVFSMEDPSLFASPSDGEIILNWYAGADELESSMWGGYSDYWFEGYEIFQGSTAQGPWTMLNTFDLINGVGIIEDMAYDNYDILQNMIIHYGSDSGLEHILSIKTDALKGGLPLINGQEYHFALRAYAYWGSGMPKTLESELQVVSVRPQKDAFAYAPGDTLSIAHMGTSDASVVVEVIDPGQLTGADYELGFEFSSGLTQGRWVLINESDPSQDTLLFGEWDDDIWGHAINYIDGFELSISDIGFEAPRLNSGWEQTVNIEGTRFETAEFLAVSPGGVDSLAWADGSRTSTVHMDTLYGPEYYYDYFEREERGAETWFILYLATPHEVRIRSFASNLGGLGGDRLADIPGMGGGTEDVEFLQADLEIRFTEAGQNASYFASTAGFVPSLTTVPFEIWDIERNIQFSVGIVDWDETGGIQDSTIDDWEHTLDGDWVIVFDREYETYRDSLQEMFNNPYSGWLWTFNNSSKFTIGDVVFLQFFNPVIPGTDVYQWTTAPPEGISDSPDELSLRQLCVYPNPFNPSTTIRYELPESADVSITIYDLLGRSVWSYEASVHPAGQYSLQWDGLNDHGRQVASGVYLISFSTSDFRVVQKAVLIR